MITELKVPILTNRIMLKEVCSIQVKNDKKTRPVLTVLNYDNKAIVTLEGFPPPLFDNFCRVFKEAKQAFDCCLHYTPDWSFISEYIDSPSY